MVAVRIAPRPAQADSAEASPARLVVYALCVLPAAVLGLACAALLAPPVMCQTKLKSQLHVTSHIARV